MSELSSIAVDKLETLSRCPICALEQVREAPVQPAPPPVLSTPQTDIQLPPAQPVSPEALATIQTAPAPQPQTEPAPNPEENQATSQPAQPGSDW